MDELTFVNQIITELQQYKQISEEDIIARAEEEELDIETVTMLLIDKGVLPPIPEEEDEEEFLINLYEN